MDLKIKLPGYYEMGIFKKEDSQLAIFSVVIITIMSALFFAADCLYNGLGKTFGLTATLECILLAFSFGVVKYLRKSEDKKLYPVLIFAWLMFCSLEMIGLDLLRIRSHLVSSGMHLLIVLSTYIIFHNRFRLQLVPAMILSTYSIISLLGLEKGLTNGTAFMVVLTFVAANVLGIAVSLSLRYSRLEHCKLQKQQDQMSRMLEKIAFVDDLTGVFNRRKIMELFESEFGRVKRYGSTLSVMMLDIDFFKHVNDKYGHDAGDCVLVEFAGRLKKLIRETDYVGRFGGEEFLVIMPETDLPGAVIVAERIKQTLDESSINIGATSIRVTASIGISKVRSEDEQKESSLKRADESLYMAKKAGRDTICSESEIFVKKDSAYYTP